jgi:hypothetical protein
MFDLQSILSMLGLTEVVNFFETLPILAMGYMLAKLGIVKTIIAGVAIRLIIAPPAFFLEAPQLLKTFF